MAQLTVHNYIVRELLYKFIRCILPIRVANNIGVFVPAYTACVKFRVDTINHRSLAQWNIFIHHNSGFLSMNPEEGLNISLYLQNTLNISLDSGKAVGSWPKCWREPADQFHSPRQAEKAAR